MYVEDVKDGKRTYTHIFAHNFLNIQLIFNPEKVLESWHRAFELYYQILCILKHVEDIEDYIMQHCMDSTHYNGTYVEDVEGVVQYMNRMKPLLCIYTQWLPHYLI